MVSVWSIASVVLAAALSVSPSKETPFNVDFFCGWGGYYRPMEWTPLEIGIATTLTEPFQGSVTVSAQQDGLNTLNIVHTFVVTSDTPLHLPLVTKFAFAADRCAVKVADRRGKICWRHDFDLWNIEGATRLLTAVNESDLLIGLVGQRKFGILRLAKESVCLFNRGPGRVYKGYGMPPRDSSSGEQRGKVYVGDKLPRMAPWDWTGFAGLDLLILYDPDWGQLNTHQQNAICQWVSNGGRLLVVLGSNPLTSANPLAQLLPFEIRDVREVTISSQALEKLGLRSDEPETVTCWSLTPAPTARLCKTEIVSDSDECLFATAYCGFGKVGVLAFDPSTMSDRQKSNTARLWVRCITSLLESAGSSSERTIEYVADAERYFDRPDYDTRRYEIGPAQSASNVVMEHLYSIAQMRPLSIWWVVLLLTLLAVLLGPVDYFILKRKDRLPLTWLTCAFWIALFTVGAYYGVQKLRGGKLQLRVVSVLDGIEDSKYKWSTLYCGLFAPYSGDYQLEQLAANQWWSGIAPMEQQIWAYGRESGSREIHCYQHDGGNLPFSLPVNIWTMQCLLNESTIEKLPFSAQVKQQGDEIILSITNDSDSPISRGYVALRDEHGFSFGSVPAHTERQFRGQLLTYYQYASSLSNIKQGALSAQGCWQRTRVISGYLAGGAAMVCAEYEQPPVPFAVKDRSCGYDHIQLVRLVVFPKK
jgi:hypothetical protein